MSDLIKEPYELSVWERKNSRDEKFLLTIGSNTMTTPYKARNPIVRTNVNGEITLTFTLCTRFFDEEKGDFVDNPFINYLHNETLLKLHRGLIPEENWEEFIIKDIQEDSSNKTLTYTTKRAWTTELGKTGYGLLLNSELMNNTGTAQELTEKIFEGTDWRVSLGDGMRFWGGKVDPVYELTTTLPSEITCIRQANVGNYNLYFDEVQKEVTIPMGSQTIYIPYSSYQNFKETSELQFLWSPAGVYKTDEEGLIYTANSYIVTGDINNIEEAKIDLTKKGDYLQNKNKTFYLKNIDRVVTEGNILAKDEEPKPAYHFVETSYLTNDTVQELIVNGKDFTTTNGWRAMATKTEVYLDYEEKTLEDIITNKYIAKLILKNNGTSLDRYIFNAAIRSNATILGGGYSNPKGIAKGDQFVLESSYAGLEQGQKLTIIFAKYDTTTNEGITEVSLKDEVFSAKLVSETKTIVTCDKGVTYSDLLSGDYGLFILIPAKTSIELESLSFYKYIPKTGNESISPSDIPESTTINEDIYILKEAITDNVTSLKDIIPYKLGDNESFNPNLYGTKYEKISSINVSKSNRFNALQEVCEAFECWADIVVNHEANGKIKKREDGSLDKNIVLKNFIGKNREVGFSYGLNLKSIKRQVVSEQIVTKLIVEQNNNENAENGFCSIIRAKDNPTKLNSIYNFNYFINQNVLSLNDVEEDFYKTDGILPQIKNLNENVLILNKELQELKALKFTCEKDAAAAKEIRDAASLEIERLQQNYKDRTGQSYTDKDFTKLTVAQQGDSTIKEIVYCIKTQNKLLQSQQKVYDNNSSKITDLEESISAAGGLLKDNLLVIDELVNEFENKYSSFIQEGTWSDESYFDDDLYYYDAENVLHTSAFPKVSYSIDVIDISVLGEEFKNFAFGIGDKTYIEDTEFFGWNQSDSSPYREEVVISQMEEYLDSPEQNKITIQNYKTQFEDLFQRIAATTQSLQYTAGAYQRAANKITATNEIDLTTLQNSLLAGVLNLQNMGNLSISWTEKGMLISSTDSSLSHKKMRLSNTGLDLSTDGGLTWRTAITGEGIVADEITTGSLNANKISIKSGDAATFIWDAKGLRAYETIWGENGEVSNVNFNNYIEFNDKGLFAYRNNGPDTTFALTAEGNLTLSGSLKVAVLEYGKVQAIGGIVLIRPSSLIKKAEYYESIDGGGNIQKQTKIWVETPSQFSAGDQCVIGSNLENIGKGNNATPYEVVSIDEEDKYLTFSGNLIETFGDLTNLALTSIVDSNNNIGIAINSSTNEAFSNARSFSIFESSVDNNTWIRDTRLLLGELPEKIVEQYKNSLVIPEDKSTTYGLYAENAIITGHINAKSGSFSGLIEAGEGHIGGWDITNTYLRSYAPAIISDGVVTVPKTSRPRIYILSGETYDNPDITNKDQQENWIYCWGNANANGVATEITFKLGKDGHLWAKGAEIEGIIKATEGDIGGWNITSTYIDSTVNGTNKRLRLVSASSSFNYWIVAFDANGTSTFSVSKEGYLTCTGATVTGTINTEAGQIGNLILSNNKLFGLANATDSWISGMNTGYHGNTANTIFLWAGAKGGENVSQSATRETFGSKDWHEARTIIQNTANFYVTHDGILHATDADVSGTITASQGRIGGWELQTGYLKSYKDENNTGKEAFYISSGNYSGTSSNLQKYWLYCRNDTNIVTFSVAKTGELQVNVPTTTTLDLAAADVDNNKKVESIDAREILRASVGLANLPSGKGDVDRDGRITASDARLASRIAVGLEGTITTTLKFEKNGLSVLEKKNNDDPQLLFYAGSGGVYISQLDTATTSTNDTTSDEKVKNNIELLNDNYEILFDNLIPRRFKYNHGSSGRYHTGFIAQEIVEALKKSNLTTQDFATVMHLDVPFDNGAEWALRKEEMVALNTWQIQKLKTRVTELEKIVETLTKI